MNGLTGEFLITCLVVLLSMVAATAQRVYLEAHSVFPMGVTSDIYQHSFGGSIGGTFEHTDGNTATEAAVGYYSLQPAASTFNFLEEDGSISIEKYSNYHFIYGALGASKYWNLNKELYFVAGLTLHGGLAFLSLREDNDPSKSNYINFYGALCPFFQFNIDFKETYGLSLKTKLVTGILLGDDLSIPERLNDRTISFQNSLGFYYYLD